MKLTERFNQKLEDKFGKYSWYPLMKTDYIFRALILSIPGDFITICFAVFNGIYGIVYQSVWYGIFAIYYILLSLQKVLLILVYRFVYKKFKNDKDRLQQEKLKIYLANGAIFIPLTIALAVMVSVFLTTSKPSITGNILAIAIATFTCYKITMSIINIVKAKSIKDDILQTLRNINLVEACIAILLLSNTLITTFGELDSGMRTITILLGFAVCSAIIGLGSYMIVKAVKKLKYKKLKYHSDKEISQL